MSKPKQDIQRPFSSACPIEKPLDRNVPFRSHGSSTSWFTSLQTVIVATVVLCFLHMPINGAFFQALAVPGSGREATSALRKANLQKLKMKEVKAKLREKGLTVSGRKADLVERLARQMFL